jgi:tetratricopeptide (TPR) repeat protein
MESNMKQRLTILVILFTFSSLSARDLYQVAFTIGKVTRIRHGKSIILKGNESLKEGDKLVLRRNARVDYTSPGGIKITVTGPSVYVHTSRNVTRKAKNTNFLSSLAMKLLKSTDYRQPRTVVLAVRGHNNAIEKKSLGRKLQKAVILVKKGRVEEAEKVLKSLEQEEALSRHARYIVLFYLGEVYFSQGDFSSALTYYKKVYRTRNRRFHQKEDAHVRAMVCTLFLKSKDKYSTLVKEYHRRYPSGRYKGVVKEIEMKASFPD